MSIGFGSVKFDRAKPIFMPIEFISRSMLREKKLHGVLFKAQYFDMRVTYFVSNKDIQIIRVREAAATPKNISTGLTMIRNLYHQEWTC